MEWLQENPTLRMQKPAEVERKLRKFIQDGPDRLQLVADFDRTLARTNCQGRPLSTSYCVFEEDKNVSKEYQKLAADLKNKYYPIEIDPNLTDEEKIPHMIKWYEESFKIILNSGVHIDEVPEMVRRADLHLRCRTSELFDYLNQLNIPILVYSAGLGNVIKLSLEQQNALKDNVTVIANFLEYDSQGTPLKFVSDTMLHMYNKDGSFPTAYDYFKSDKMQNRTNAILLGDSLSDCTMVDGAPCIKPPPEGASAVLRVGYLNHRIEERLDQYLDSFDIVLLDDQTLDVPFEIIKRISSSASVL